MKKVFFGFLAIVLSGQLALAQPVLDQAVIPMAITVNSILRMNVVSGGNMEFVFNTLDDYTNGIGTSTSAGNYRTNLTIAASVDWDLSIYASSASFIGDGGTIGLNYVGYTVVDNTGTNAIGTEIDYIPGVGTYDVLTGAAVTFLQPGTTNVGGSAANNFFINWECATAVGGGIQTPISGSGAISGRYSTTVILALTPN